MISFVLLNWNSGQFLQRALDSLTRQTSSRWELIIVDNGSSNASVKVLEEFCKEQPVKKFLRFDNNIGYAAGMNAGLVHATGSLIVPLNSDVYLHDTFVEYVEEFYREQQDAFPAKRIGMIAVPVFNWRYSTSEDCLTEELQTVGVSLTKRFALSLWHPEFEPIEALLGPSGCAPIFTRQALDAALAMTGYVYDPAYVSFGEDTDIYVRLLALGYETACCANARLWHIGSASTSGSLSFHTKPLPLQLLSHINDWRTVRKLRLTRQQCAIIPWMIANDIHSVLTSPSKFQLLCGMLGNYCKVLVIPPDVRYPPVRFIFTGRIFSSSARFLHREGYLPALHEKPV